MTLTATLREATANAIAAADLAKPRSSQPHAGVSDMGVCRRRVAYLVAGVEPSDQKGTHPAAQLGTWIHEGLLPWLALEIGADPKHAVEIDVVVSTDAGQIPGHADLWARHLALVVDLKTVSDWAMERALSDGPTRRQLWQGHLYARALIDAGENVENVGVVFVSRVDGKIHVHVGPYDPEVAQEAIDWWAEVNTYQTPEEAPRDESGPGLSIVCDGCQFRSRCWPAIDGAAPQSALISNDDEALAALELYHASQRAEAAAKARKEFARAMLDATPKGMYGSDSDGFKLGWSGGGVTYKLDPDAARELLQANGLPVPEKEQKSRPRIRVTRVVATDG